MKIELPIFLANNYFNECWSFEFFCIIDTVKKYQNWKFLYYNNLTTNGENDLIYGKNGQIYDQKNVYKEILDIEELPYTSVTADNLISFVRQNIYNKKYIILLLFNKNTNNYHEYLFYSFNDKNKEFTYPSLINNKIILNKMKYEELTKLFINSIENIDFIYNNFAFKFNYFSPINIIKIKKNVKFKEPNIMDLYYFVKNTYNNCWKSSKVYFNGNFIHEYYEGLLGTINAILVEFDYYRYNNKLNYEFGKNIKTYYLYRKFFFDALSFYFKKIILIYDEYGKLNYGFAILENVILTVLKNKILDSDKIENIRNNIITIFKYDFTYIENVLKFVEEKIKK